MDHPIDHHRALIFTMVLVAAAEGEITDTELETIGRLVRYLPVFAEFDHAHLTTVGRECADLLRRDDGLDVALGMIAAALPEQLRETAYAFACDVAAADARLADEELHLLQLLRSRLRIDSLVASAIERATRARHATL